MVSVIRVHKKLQTFEEMAHDMVSWQTECYKSCVVIILRHKVLPGFGVCVHVCSAPCS